MGPFGQHQCTSLLLIKMNQNQRRMKWSVKQSDFRIREAEMDYRDIIYMLDKDIVVQERRGKHERICHMTNLLQEIASNAEVAATKAEQALQLVKGKNGRKEEEDFCKKILLNGKEVEGKITSVKKQVRKVTANV